MIRSTPDAAEDEETSMSISNHPSPEWYSLVTARPSNAGFEPSACFATQGPSTILGIIFMVSSRTVSVSEQNFDSIRRCFRRSPDSVFSGGAMK